MSQKRESVPGGTDRVVAANVAIAGSLGRLKEAMRMTLTITLPRLGK